MGSNSSSPRTVQEIFNDFSARRNAIVRALTNEVDQFYSLCDQEKDHVCLYGHPNESWEVTVPAEEVPPELPEPVLGINVDRNEINRRVWLSIVAAHSDCWLLSVAFFFGSQLNRNERECLFSLMNDLPTVLEVVTGRKPIKDKPTTESGHKSKRSSKRSNDGQIRSYAKLLEESKGEDDEEYNENICGSCGGYYDPDEFWICCDICDRWFHGECVKITPDMAESIMLYKCPSCNTKELGNRD